MRDPLTYCLVLIKRRLRSCREIEQGLRRRDTSEEDIAAVVLELEASGLVNDQRFAEAWVHTRDRLSPRGKNLLSAELMQKGIAKDIIQQVLRARDAEAQDEQEDQPTEYDLAKEVARGRERVYSNLSDEVRKRRLTAHLLRRGFSYDTIRRILET